MEEVTNNRLDAPGGGDKETQLSKLWSALKNVFKSGLNVFDFLNDDFAEFDK